MALCAWILRDGRNCGRPCNVGEPPIPLCARHCTQLENSIIDAWHLEGERRRLEHDRAQKFADRLARVKGSVRQDPDSGRWQYRFRMPAIDSGQRARTVRRGGFATKRDAQRALRAALAAIRDTPMRTADDLAAALTALRVDNTSRYEAAQRQVADDEARDARSKRRQLHEGQRARFVYYIERPDGAIKIGTTWNLTQRLSDLRNVSPVRLLAAHGGGQPAEAFMHRRFSNARRDREWFDPVPELVAHIAHVARRRSDLRERSCR
jgi:PAS domain-containing protein